ncbi:shikimate dehydrogenase [Terrimonas sp. NA20]|uniref:Shikimate dehydrogenase n=1 Tax=Terrimonas ginsenosidimutans TaxID=2908004 RepID=A0ABS9KRT6_9BACT|nr:shikimate dehydrogenase [Terrimonas ginsenosidimutans]MCG2614985.1 shikimate dehydrogenase [Terrimonas ginsenosidimutans]
MRLFGLIGNPLTHSFSKKYFTEKFEREGLTDCRYELFPISSIEELPKLLRDHPELCGLNVTIPYKEQVLSYLNEENELVQAIRACNCIDLQSGRLKGYNTDVLGFEQSLRQLFQPHHKKALILGTGGVSKAVQYILQKMGLAYRYVSRKPGVHNFSYEQLTADVMQEYTLIVNTTPLGTYPNITEAPQIPYKALTSDHYLFDMVYNPSQTLFLKMGEERGAVVKNGYDMLEIQADESWKIWSRV